MLQLVWQQASGTAGGCAVSRFSSCTCTPFFSFLYLAHSLAPLAYCTPLSFSLPSPSPSPPAPPHLRSLRSLARFSRFILFHVHILLLATLARTLLFLFTHFQSTLLLFCTSAGEGFLCGYLLRFWLLIPRKLRVNFPMFFLSVDTTIVYGRLGGLPPRNLTILAHPNALYNICITRTLRCTSGSTQGALCFCWLEKPVMPYSSLYGPP